MLGHTANDYYARRLVFSPFVRLGVLRLSWPLTTQEYFYVWLQGCQELKSTRGISITRSISDYYQQVLIALHKMINVFMIEDENLHWTWVTEAYFHTRTHALNAVFFYIAGTTNHSQ